MQSIFVGISDSKMPQLVERLVRFLMPYVTPASCAAALVESRSRGVDLPRWKP